MQMKPLFCVQKVPMAGTDLPYLKTKLQISDILALVFWFRLESLRSRRDSLFIQKSPSSQPEKYSDAKNTDRGGWGSSGIFLRSNSRSVKSRTESYISRKIRKTLIQSESQRRWPLQCYACLFF